MVTMYPPIGHNFTWCTPFISEKDNIPKSCKVQYTTQEYHIDILLSIVKNEGGFIFPGEVHRSPDAPPYCKILVRTLPLQQQFPTAALSAVRL